MRRRTPTIATKLSAIDHIKFEAFCRMEGKTKTEIARDAILHFMKIRESERKDEHQDALEKRLHKLENRLAGILVKQGIAISALEHLFWSRTDPDVRPKLFSECYLNGVKGMRSKLQPEEDLRTQTGD